MKNFGEQFLHQKDSQLHVSKPVEHEKERKKLKGEKVSQKPTDKLADWMKILERTHGHRDDPRVLERIKEYYHGKHVIKPEAIPESHYENQRRIAREQGHGDIEITDNQKKELNEAVISDQTSTLDNWVNYLASSDSDSYPMWAKYWAFNGMLKLSTYNKERHAFGKRKKDTVAPFPDLNREALAYVVDIIVKKANKEEITEQADNKEFQKLLQGSNFGKLYAYAIEKVTPTEESELVSVKGEWIKYDKDSDHMPLVKSIQGHGTGWCTAGETTAKSQLQGGDFHIYYSYNKDGKPTIPRVAIRMQGQNIAEIRGIAHEQNLDPYIGDVVSERLKDFSDGEKYKKKTADMKRLTEIDKKITNEEELTKDDIRFLYEMDEKIQGFGYQTDPRIKEILKSRDIKKDISFVLGCSEEEISTTEEEVLSGGIKFHYGNLDLRGLQSAEGLELPETMNGDLNLNGLKSAKGLKLPKTMNGSLYLNGLESAEGLELPKTMNGSLNLSGLKSAKGLKLTETMNGDLNLSGLKSAKGLKLPKTMNGSLNLSGLKSAVGLELPETMNGDLHLYSLKSAKGLKLPKTMNGSLNLSGLESAEGLELPETMNGSLYLISLQSAKKEELREKYPQINIV